MKIAVMQPYFFPYIGYFELIKAVDYFVIFDDVNYIKRGWVNKNRILSQGSLHNIVLPVQKSSQNRKINEHRRTTDPKAIGKLKKQLESAYGKTPNFSTVYPLLCRLIDYSETNLAQYLTYSLNELSSFLGFSTKFLYSSELMQDHNWESAEQRIIAITKHLEGHAYYNLPGGAPLYDKSAFAEQGIELNFIARELNIPHTTEQGCSLSIIHYLMNADTYR